MANLDTLTLEIVCFLSENATASKRYSIISPSLKGFILFTDFMVELFNKLIGAQWGSEDVILSLL
jgi:hypothetical protein